MEHRIEATVERGAEKGKCGVLYFCFKGYLFLIECLYRDSLAFELVAGCLLLLPAAVAASEQVGEVVEGAEEYIVALGFHLVLVLYLFVKVDEVFVSELLGGKGVAVRYAAFVVVVVVETGIGVVYCLTALYEGGSDHRVFEYLTLGIAHEEKELGTVNFIARVAVFVSFAPYPIAEYIAAAGDFLGLERNYVAVGRFVVLDNGIFKNVNIGVRCQYAHIVVVGSRCDCVVTIDKCNVFASGCGKACIACRGETAVFLVYDAHFVALLGVTVADGAAVVGRAVVDENKLIVGVCLLQNAFNTILQVSSDFVNRYYDA